MAGPRFALNVAARVLAAAATFAIIALALTKAAGGWGLTSPFALHPILMTAAFAGFFTLGTASYVADYGERLFGAFSCVLGLLVIWNLHALNHSSQIGTDPDDDAAVKAHVWLGYASIAAVLLQVAVGLHKYVVRTRDNLPVHTWHGKLGPVAWTLGLANVALGAYIGFYAKNGQPAAAAVAIVLVGLAWLATMVLLFTQPGTHARLDDMHKADDYRGSSMGSLNGRLIT